MFYTLFMHLKCILNHLFRLNLYKNKFLFINILA